MTRRERVRAAVRLIMRARRSESDQLRLVESDLLSCNSVQQTLTRRLTHDQRLRSAVIDALGTRSDWWLVEAAVRGDRPTMPMQLLFAIFT